MVIEVLLFPFGGAIERMWQPFARFMCSDWRIELDAIADKTSEFRLPHSLITDVKPGVRVMVRYLNYLDWKYDGTKNMVYFGVVESHKDDTLITRDFRSYFKTNIPAFPKSNDETQNKNPVDYIYVSIERWIKHWNYFDVICQYYKSPEYIPWVYENTELSLTDFSETLSKIFKQYQVLPNLNYYMQAHYNGSEMYNSYQVRMQIGKNYSDIVTIDTAMTDQETLEVYDKPVGDYNYNVVQVLNTETNALTKVYSEGWTADTHSIFTCVLYDPAQNKDVTPTEYGKQFLTKNLYDHEITLGVTITEDLLTLGQNVKILHEGRIINSIISGITYNSDKPFATVKCGNIRTELEILL